MRDDAAVCANCGKTPDGTPGKASVGGASKSKPKNKKIIKDVIAIVAAILVFAIAVGVTTSFVGYRGAVRKAMNAYKKADVDALVDMSCAFFKNQDYKDSLAYKYKFRMEEDFDGVDPSECSVKYKITKTAEFSDSQVTDLMEDLVYGGLATEQDVNSVKKIMNINLEVTIKHGSDSKSVSKLILLVKESGSWKLMTFE